MKFIVFDLDGTLVDTLNGLTLAINETLKELNINKTYLNNEVKTFIGGGVKKLFKEALNRDFSKEELDLLLKNYLKFQNTSKIYDGVLDTLKILKDKGYVLFIYSNKPDLMLKHLMHDIFKENRFLFTYVQGNDNRYKVKPDPEFLNFLFTKFDLDPKRGYYVGDSFYDYLTAKNSSLTPIIVNYGYGNYEEINKIKDLKIIGQFNKLLEEIK